MIISLPQTSLRVIQITDTHLFRDPAGELLKLNTQESFEQVLQLIAKKEGRIDLILGTGDIAQDASVESYQRFIQGMRQFYAPFYWIPGNHDNRSVMENCGAPANALQSVIRTGLWQIVMLDTSVAGEVHGWLAQSELDLLEIALTEAERDGIAHTVVCLHHNPIPGNSHWMEDIGLRNAAELFKVLDRHHSVRAVVYGHIHQTLDFERRGVRYLCTPSTCIQFKQAVTDFALDDRNPAYRWLELHADGYVATGVERVTEYTYVVDHSSVGY
jgi:3',5'-cyclic-AMP phosphodiesterase